ncbi:diguanylate cyclase domain-containing protein [Shewanella sp. UCD-KL12]|uniref:GGDEF domain-containing protein n=1 Tax=Shewanella sp. UCD-KL12 TaxID=1917163 RepID=UPI00097072D7|nr:diguanylate cyclase [Shewanella sp. UCD-KL12]
MNRSLRVKILFSSCIVSTGLVSLCLLQAQTKLLVEIDWLDVFTEGALLLLGISWLVLVLLARPGGKVTQLLLIGLLAYSLGCFMDLLDEFFVNASLPLWFNLLEKIPTPLGLLTLTYGLWLWREEQTRINEQLRTREQFYRQHQLVDHVTQIYAASAMRHQLSKSLKQVNHLALIMIDLDNFTAVNQKHGLTRGDKILTEVAQLIATQLRSQDLVCRYAGDRFILMLPECSPALATAITSELIHNLALLGYRASSAELHWQRQSAADKNSDAETLIAEINLQMEKVKQARHWPKAV